MKSISSQKLSPDEITANLSKFPGWSVVNEMLHKEYTFPDFASAFGFMTRVALLSEKLNHHASIWNCYNRVTLDINTHDAGGITAKDFKWVEKIEGIPPSS